MSEQGPYTEAELAELISEYLSCKYDSSAIVKPTPTVVTDIYRRFLDKIRPRWEQSSRFPTNALVEVKLAACLRRIFSGYWSDHEFNPIDIMRPTRKRTTTFLNVLIYILARFEQKLGDLRVLESQQADDRKLKADSYAEIRKKREYRDSLAAKRGESRSSDELEQMAKSRTKGFEEMEKKAQLIAEEYKSIKDENTKMCAKLKECQEPLAQVLRQLEESDYIIKVREDYLQLEQKLRNLRLPGKEFLYEHQIAQEQSQTRLDKIYGLKEEIRLTGETRNNSLNAKLSLILTRMKKLDAEGDREDQLLEEYSKKSDEDLNRLKISNEAARERSREARSRLIESKREEDLIIKGRNCQVNTTYVKDSVKC